jgi:hypothetical protein
MPNPLDLRPRICCSNDERRFIHQIRDGLLLRPLHRFLSFLSLVFVSLSATFLTSCGGLVSSSAPPPVTVTVSPASAQTVAGGTVLFTATVQNAGSSAITWQVNGKPSGDIATVGTIIASGVYTAVYTAPNSPMTVTVTAALQSDSTKSASASVTIQPISPIKGSLSISPQLSSVTTSQTLQLQVTTTGINNNLVNWAVSCVPVGNCLTGTITQSGLYTPPNAAGPHIITAALIANPSVIGSAQVEVTDIAGTFTWRNDNSRSGQNQKEFALAPATVASSTFGKLFSCVLDGNAYAQPLYVANLSIPGTGTRNVIFVATEKDVVYAFDADANPCVELWRTPLFPPEERAIPTPELGGITSKDIVPFIGITGTPVIDVISSHLYVVAETQIIATNPSYLERLYALDLATGQPKIQPAGVQILTAASVVPIFNSLLANQRAALLLDNGNVYVAFASHHDLGDYHGWLMGYDASTLNQNMVFDVTPGGLQGGIWQSGGGPSADVNHNVFVATGNGSFDANQGTNDYGDSFLRLSTAGALFVADYFSPCNQQTFFNMDQDLGSSAPVLLPDSAGLVSTPLMMGGSKSGSLYVLNRDSLGGYTYPCPDPVASVQEVPIGDGPILSTPLFWNNFIYVAAGNGKLKALPMTAGLVNPTALPSQSSETLGPQGATPVVSSNGANNAIIWLIDTSGALVTPNTPAILRAFDASNLSNEIYNSATAPADRDKAGLAVKFTVPTVANGKVYVGTQTELDVYGLLP